jgi:hypothetical protein
LLSPSFFALVSGTLLGIAIDLFKSIFSVQGKESFTRFTMFSFVTVSVICFLYLSLKLEQLREETTLGDRLDRIRVDVPLRHSLWLAFLLGLINLGLALASMALSYITLR